MEYWVNVPSVSAVHVGNSPPAARSSTSEGDDKSSLVENLVTFLDTIVKLFVF